MKKPLMILGLMAMLACEKSMVSDPAPAINVNASGQLASYEDQIGKFVYRKIRLHSDVDPYSYIAADKAKVLKQAFDDLKTSGIQDPNVALEKAFSSKSARTSAVLSSSLKSFNTTTLEYFTGLKTVDVEQIDKWFATQQSMTKSRTDISQADQSILLSTQALVRYAVRARIEAISLPVTSKNARTGASTAAFIDFGCLQQEAKCATNTILTYVGYGASIDPAHGPVVGAIIGTIISLGTCQCQANSTPCQYPARLLVPAQCVSPGSDLKVTLLGFGENANGFQLEIWDTSDRQNRLTWPIQDGTDANIFYIQAATLQGRHKVYALAYTNCGTGDLKTAPAIVEIDLDLLAQPDAVISGPTNTNVGNTYTYSIVGGNFDMNNVQWSIFSTNVGTIVSQNPNSAQIQWTRPIGNPNAVYASVHNSCTSTQVSLGVTVN